MNISVTSNAPQYRDALVQYMATFRKKRAEALRIQGRLLGQRLVQFTPPKTQKQGKSRVEKDIKKIFLGLREMDFDQAAQGMRDNIIETVGGEAVVRVFAKKDGTVYGVDRRLYRPDTTLEEMSAFHQSKRDKRGRVGNSGQYARDIGRWKFLDVMAVPADRLTEYIKSVQARTGQGKGGWASGVLALGGKVAQYIAIHARTAGTFEDHIETDGYMVFENRSAWASGGDDDRIIDNAIAARTRDILKAVQNANKESGKYVFR